MSRPAPAPVDAAMRDLALDPATSCIVQAPAGSGKTTLLVSRFVRLLALADYPEQVLAITFTRKAAAEMRLRVVAVFGDDASPEGARARARDAERGWKLADNPSRLNIRTIDSFAMSLTRQMPVASGFDRSARLVEDAGELYSLAARRLFRRLYLDDPLAPEIARFIELTDNDAHRARRLLASMLARRDHWLDEVTEVAGAYRKAPESVAGLLNGALDTLLAAVAGDLEKDLSPATLRELEWAVEFSSGVERSSPGAFWRAAGERLTTQNGKLRRKLTIGNGFPPGCREEKRRAMELIDTLGAEGLETRFAALRQLPPEPLAPEQVLDLVSICISLSLAVLDLSSVMRAQGVVDFTEVTLAARRALRSGESPTELALSIDNRIRHILVDEFQDTSVVQFRLLELLVQGWSGESRVSLFAVGDPMQSIYRFRDADVGLFYRAESRGLDQLRLRPLRLAMNFRSAPRLVDWYNATFPEVMGKTADPLLGRVPYNPCKAGVESGGEASLRLFGAEADERQALVEHIATLLADDPGSRIALLVRSRTHLPGVLDALRGRGIRWQATDIDALADTPAVTDLLSLAAALTRPSDRLAWYSLLRAPWVGLDLGDLEILGQIQTWELASLRRASSDLSPAGRTRLARLLEVLEARLPALYEAPPRSVLESIWIHCGGPAAYGDAAALDHAERFLELVDELGSDGLDVDRLRFGADNLFAADSAAASLQILTIHKAKGLEFDHVLLPFLDRQTKSTEAPLLRWRLQDNRLLMAARQTGPLYDWLAEEDRQREQHELQRLLYVGCTRARRTLLLTAVHSGKPPAGRSLLNLLRARAATVPIETAPHTRPPRPAPSTEVPVLHRLAGDFQWQPPARKPLYLARIRHQLPAADAGALSPGSARGHPSQEDASRKRGRAPSGRSDALSSTPASPSGPRDHAGRRLSARDIPSRSPAEGSTLATQVGDGCGPEPRIERVPDPVADRRETALGIVVHAALCDLGSAGLPANARDWIETRMPAWARQLAGAGLPEPDIDRCREEAARQIANVLADETGRWILAGGTDAVSEFSVSGVVEGAVRTCRFDRAFEDGGERWVIDYKTGPVPAGARSLERFVARHRPQLDRYRVLAEALYGQPVRTALYLTALPRLIEP